MMVWAVRSTRRPCFNNCNNYYTGKRCVITIRIAQHLPPPPSPIQLQLSSLVIRLRSSDYQAEEEWERQRSILQNCIPFKYQSLPLIHLRLTIRSIIIIPLCCCCCCSSILNEIDHHSTDIPSRRYWKRILPRFNERMNQWLESNTWRIQILFQ